MENSKVREENYWLTRNPETLYRYWETLNHPHRKLIVKILEKFYPFESLLEVGCGCGPNLKNIKDRFPEVDIVGVDINKFAIFGGQKHLEDINLLVAPSYQIPLADKTFDIILTDAVLMYLSMDKLKDTIKEFSRIVRKGLILVELDGSSRIGTLENGYWCRNYQSLLESYGFKVVKQKITKEIWDTPPWDTKGCIFTAVLPSITSKKN